VTLATEAWPAVFGGLIPIIGLAAIGYIIYRAAKSDDDEAEKSEMDNGETGGNPEDD
jgi:hypothetical protein